MEAKTAVIKVGLIIVGLVVGKFAAKALKQAGVNVFV